MRNRLSNKLGYTLTEAVVASGVVLMLTGGLVATGTMLMKMSLHNRLSIEAQGFALSRIEEITGQPMDTIIIQTPYASQTNYVQDKYPVIREVEIIGHAADKSVETNLADSAYLEIHVEARFRSPFRGRTNTVVFSTLVADDPE